MDELLTGLWPQLLLVIGPIFLAVLTAVVWWAATQVAGILKTKWGIEIDVAALQAELAKAAIGTQRKDMLHSAVETGVATVIDEIEAAPLLGGRLQIPAPARKVIMDHLMRSIPGTIATLSPLPDVIDNIAIKAATDLIANRRAGR